MLVSVLRRLFRHGSKASNISSGRFSPDLLFECYPKANKLQVIYNTEAQMTSENKFGGCVQSNCQIALCVATLICTEKS